MLSPGPAQKVTIHLNEDTVSDRDFLYNEIFSFLFSHGVAGATLTRPEAGFGSHHRIHTANSSPRGSEHMPVRIEFIESRGCVEALMPALCELISDGLIEAQETTVFKSVAGRESV
jgi:PII-like signaling protein